MTHKKIEKPETSDYKWGSYGSLDMKPCKARTKLIKYIENGGRIKATVECEIYDIYSGFDGIGQEFIIDIKKVKTK